MTSSLKNIKNLKGKRVLVRVDFNVALKKGKVLEESKIKASLPTLQYLLKKKAKIILITHVGRPEGKVVPELSVKPIAKVLSKMLKKKVKIVSDTNLTLPSPTRRGPLMSQKPGEIVLLENIRFFEGEEKNSDEFVRQIASIADMFVLDGFAVAHRESASVTGVTKYLPSYAGFLVQKEIEGLNKILHKPKHPAVFIVGGAKIETKLPVIKNILKIADAVLVGGAIFNTYLKAKGYGVGASLVDDGFEKEAISTFSKKKIFKPIDVIVGDKKGKKVRVVEIEKTPHIICAGEEMILDIGPETVKQFEKIISKAKTLVWNGAMGFFEVPVYANGTYEIVRALVTKSHKGAYTVVGGGESILVLDQMNVKKKITFVSTGGGAMLEYLSGKKLPGLKIL